MILFSTALTCHCKIANSSLSPFQQIAALAAAQVQDIRIGGKTIENRVNQYTFHPIVEIS